MKSPTSTPCIRRRCAGPTSPCPCVDIDKTIDWYERFTPLELLDRRDDADGYGAWLGHPRSGRQAVHPRAGQLPPRPGQGPAADHGAVRPHRHRGHRAAPRSTRSPRGARPRAAWPGRRRRCPPPIGYICALTDPDGNMIEFSYDQGVYATVQEVWGNGSERRRVAHRRLRRLPRIVRRPGDPEAVAAFVTDDFINEHTAALGSGCVGHRRVPPAPARVPRVDARAALRGRGCHRRR